MKKLWKSVKVWQIYGRDRVCGLLFLAHPVKSMSDNVNEIYQISLLFSEQRTLSIHRATHSNYINNGTVGSDNVYAYYTRLIC